MGDLLGAIQGGCYLNVPVCRQFIESAYDRAAREMSALCEVSPEFCHTERPEWQNSTRRPRRVSVDDSLGGEATRGVPLGGWQPENIEGVGALERGGDRGRVQADYHE